MSGAKDLFARVILLAFLGNLIVRHNAGLVPRLVEGANEALAGPFAAASWLPVALREVQKHYRTDETTWLWRSLKLVGALSGGVSRGDWRIVRKLPEFYHTWTRPIL